MTLPYVRRIPVHRVLRTLVHFDMAVLLYLAAYYFMGRTFSLQKILLALLGWESLGNSNWYIFVMLILYLITWLAFRILKDKPAPALLLITVLTVISMYILSLHKTDYWYNTMLCYPAGMWYGLFKEKIDAKLKTTKNYILAALILLTLLLIVYKTRQQIYMYAIGAVVFALVVVMFTMKMQLKNPLLEFPGIHRRASVRIVYYAETAYGLAAAYSHWGKRLCLCGGLFFAYVFGGDWVWMGL